MGKVIKKGGVSVTISSQSGHAYQMAKRCNEKRVMFEACRWAERGARVSSISPGIIVTPLAIDEFNGPRGDFYKIMLTHFGTKYP